MEFLGPYAFMLYAALAGIGVGIIAGPVGSLLIWRRMAYFGDTLAHASLMGVSLSLLLTINLYVGLFAICMLVALGLGFLGKNKFLANDSILTLLSQLLLALGLLAITRFKSYRVDLLSYLYGDILAVNFNDLIWIYSTIFLVLALLKYYWRGLLNYCISPDLATVEQVPVSKLKFGLLFGVAVVFAVAIKVVGVLLLNALFIIPAASARFIAKTPEQMAFIGSLLAVLSVIGGLLFAVVIDLPAGPAIVAVSGVLFFLTLARKHLFK